MLNRNAENMGIGAHVSKVWFDIAKGDWIIVSAGDDVSLPHRVERLMEVARPEIGAVHHPCIPIDEFSNIMPYDENEFTHTVIRNELSVEEIIENNKWLKGATMCLNKQMLVKYGKLSNEVVNEDNILMYRAQDFGGVLFLNEPLMLYRIHSESVSHKYLLNDSIKHFQKRIVQNTDVFRCLN